MRPEDQRTDAPAAPQWSHARAAATMVGVALLWSTAGVVSRQLTQAQGFEVTFWRSFFTVLALLVILPAWHGRQVFARMPWSRRALWLSGVCWAVMFTAFMVALTMTGVARVLITMALGPLLTALLARVVTGHRLPRRTWWAIAVAGCGMAYMFSGQLGGSAGMKEWVGSLVALGVPIAAAINWTVVQRSQLHGEPVDLVPAVLLGAVISSLVTVPLALPFKASVADLGWLAFLGTFQLAVPCVLAVLCARILPPAEISLLALLEIIFGIALVWLIAGEAPGAQVLTGGTLVIGALVANELLGWHGRSSAAR